jgi:hypothetical protein
MAKSVGSAAQFNRDEFVVVTTRGYDQMQSGRGPLASLPTVLARCFLRGKVGILKPNPIG